LFQLKLTFKRLQY